MKERFAFLRLLWQTVTHVVAPRQRASLSCSAGGQRGPKPTWWPVGSLCKMWGHDCLVACSQLLAVDGSPWRSSAYRWQLCLCLCKLSSLRPCFPPFSVPWKDTLIGFGARGNPVWPQLEPCLDPICQDPYSKLSCILRFGGVYMRFWETLFRYTNEFGLGLRNYQSFRDPSAQLI